jgi:hypothetical protein
MPLMGIRRAHQTTARSGALIAMMVHELFKEAAKHPKLEWVELSWVLETNTRMVSIVEGLLGPPAKRYRLYEKALS